MREISNSTLALLVVLAIVVSVFGSLMSLNRLDQLRGFGGITGLIATNATPVGRANLSVEAAVYLNLTADSEMIQLGVIDLGYGNDSITVDDYWHLINDGSVNVSIVVYSALQDNTDDGLKNGSGIFSAESKPAGSCLEADPSTCFQIKCNTTESGYDCNSSVWYPLQTDAAAGGEVYLFDLGPADASDEAWFAVNVTVPLAEPAGEKTLQVFFKAANSET